MSKVSGTCIFCGRGDLSKEHILPSWLQPILSKRFPKTRHTVNRYPLFDGSVTGVHKSYRPLREGDPLVWKLRVVCRPCNNGWMSRLQTDAKPILLPLIAGDWSQLTPEAVETLVAWIAMSTMVFEFADPPTAAINPAERQLLMDTRTLPENWRIWMGRYVGSQDRNFAHTSILLNPDYLPPDVTHGRGQVTALTVGQAVFLVLTEVRGLPVPLPPGMLFFRGFSQLWPSIGVKLRPIRPLDQEQISEAWHVLRATVRDFDPR